MSLDKNTLEKDLVKVLQGKHDNYLDAGKGWASAYAAYAAEATGCAGTNPLPTARQAAEKILGLTLSAAFKASIDPPSFSNNVGTALAGFWNTPPMVFTPAGPLTGAVTPNPALVLSFAAAISTVIAPELARVLGGGGSDVEKSAKNIADALDTATKTVIVSYVGTGACSSTIT